MELVNEKETFERRYTEGGDSEEKQPIFFLRKLTGGEVDSINDQMSVTDTLGNFKFLSGTAMRLKIKFGLKDWKNVTDSLGNAVPCNDDNKEKLPQGVRLWVAKEIDKLNGFIRIPEDERKNS